MKVPDLTDLELSNLICAHLGIPRIAKHQWNCPWISISHIPGAQCSCRIGEYPNVVTDPAMRDLLQQKLSERFNIKFWHRSKRESGPEFSVEFYQHSPVKHCEDYPQFIIGCATRERLWPEAFALAHHLDADRQL